MPRPVMFDCISAAQIKEQTQRMVDAKEKWIKTNKNGIWQQALGPIQSRIACICEDKTELMRKLMDSKDEYFRYCKASPPQQVVESDSFVIRVGPDSNDECDRDPAIPQRTPPEHITALIFEGNPKEGLGHKRYLQVRYDSGLPETKFCYPPTTNSEYAWKLKENVLKKGCSKSSVTMPRLSAIGPAFYRSRGIMCKADYAPFHFPRNYN